MVMHYKSKITQRRTYSWRKRYLWIFGCVDLWNFPDKSRTADTSVWLPCLHMLAIYYLEDLPDHRLVPINQIPVQFLPWLSKGTSCFLQPRIPAWLEVGESWKLVTRPHGQKHTAPLKEHGQAGLQSGTILSQCRWWFFPTFSRVSRSTVCEMSLAQFCLCLNLLHNSFFWTPQNPVHRSGFLWIRILESPVFSFLQSQNWDHSSLGFFRSRILFWILESSLFLASQFQTLGQLLVLFQNIGQLYVLFSQVPDRWTTPCSVRRYWTAPYLRLTSFRTLDSSLFFSPQFHNRGKLLVLFQNLGQLLKTLDSSIFSFSSVSP